jgi:hypothetical protein
MPIPNSPSCTIAFWALRLLPQKRVLRENKTAAKNFFVIMVKYGPGFNITLKVAISYYQAVILVALIQPPG